MSGGARPTFTLRDLRLFCPSCVCFIYAKRKMILPGRNDTTLHYFADNLPDTGIEVCRAGIDDEFGVFRGFVRRGDSGEVGDLSGTGFFVHAFCVAALADLDRAVAEYLDEIAMLDHAAHALAINAKGGNESGQHDHARLHEELGHFADATDIFHSVFGREAKVAAQPVTHVVAVQYEGAAAHLVQFLFDRMRQSGFSCA